MAIQMTAYCEYCGGDADRAYCEKHLDRLLAEEYEKGKNDGYADGYKDGHKDGTIEAETTSTT